MKKIPYDGPVGSGGMPSGPVQIGDDWPGVFIRGDDTNEYTLLLRYLRSTTSLPFIAEGIDEFIKLLESCQVDPARKP